MRICIVGAGAIGGFVGAKLARAGEDVTLIARGEHLDAIRTAGLKLVTSDGDEETATNVRATDKLEEAGRHDLVILALKAHQIADVAQQLPGLYDEATPVITMQNGIPWWYFQRHGGPLDGSRLRTLDPEGVIERNVPADRIIGCIAYPATEKTAPGVIHHVEGNRFPFGELDGTKSERAAAIAAVFTNAGFKSRVVADIRSQIWLKAWGNLSFNPISALTGATLAEICRFPETRALAAAMMQEARAIAEKLGVTFRHTIEQRIAGAEKVGDHKTSMLQDLESGRPLELSGLVEAIIELGRLTETPTPSIDAVFALVKLRSSGDR